MGVICGMRSACGVDRNAGLLEDASQARVDSAGCDHRGGTEQLAGSEAGGAEGGEVQATRGVDHDRVLAEVHRGARPPHRDHRRSEDRVAAAARATVRRVGDAAAGGIEDPRCKSYKLLAVDLDELAEYIMTTGTFSAEGLLAFIGHDESRAATYQRRTYQWS